MKLLFCIKKVKLPGKQSHFYIVIYIQRILDKID